MTVTGRVRPPAIVTLLKKNLILLYINLIIKIYKIILIIEFKKGEKNFDF